MSDNKIDINIVPKFIDNALSPVSKEIGEDLVMLINLAWTPVLKMKAKRDKNLEKFLKELDEELKKIPEDKLQEAPAHIVGPILEDVGKYYHDQEYLRKMFAKLISSSMNTQNRNIHPSYHAIIKQLSLNEALLLRIMFYKYENDTPYFSYSIDFICSYLEDCKFDKDLIPYDLIAIQYYGENDNRFLTYGGDDFKFAINALLRLGLIHISFEELTDKEAKNFIPKTHKNILSSYSYKKIKISSSSLGTSFASACITPDDRLSIETS